MVVTATSRKARAGEVHGKDYFFISKEEFQGMIDGGELLEHAVVYGEFKGIPKQQVRFGSWFMPVLSSLLRMRESDCFLVTGS